MDVTAIALQQVALQAQAGLGMIKQQAKAEQAVAHMVQQAATGGPRGQNLDISV